MAAVENYSSVTARPIRPLPKRRLRSRLSEEANAALFASPQQPSTPLFYFPYNNYAGDPALGGTSSPNGFSSGQGTADNLQDSSDEEDNSSSSVSRGVGNGINGPGDVVGAADPYEWAEGTNNKKKRKIPTQSSGAGGGAGNGMSGSYTAAPHSSPGFSPTSAASPRSRWKSSGSSQRSPLSAISSANHASLRRSTRRCPPSPSADSAGRRLNGKPSNEEPVTPTKASRQNSTDSAGVPKQTQFTFVCESPVSANLAFTSPGSSSVSAATAADNTTNSKTVHTVGTQTSPNISNSNTAYPPTPQPAKKKGNRNRRPDYAQILQRRRRQEAAAHGNNNGEIWICEFCEYESIFGVPPEALMRQYEIKDRKERRRLAEKKRLLEKAKQKGKKNSGRHNTGKKGNHRNDNSVPPPPPPSTTDSQGTQSDNTPLASAAQTPALKPQRHSQQVQTDTCVDCGGHHPVSHGRGAAVNGTGKNVADGSGTGGDGKAATS